ncbi:MAG TPA: sodium:solute symporter family protein [Firmicutes bacterium]|nr:sodium:solute symporter family protein [Bacillota bacterium]
MEESVPRELSINLIAVDWVVILAYIALMLYVGYYFSRKHKSFDDYFLASKGMTTPLLVATLVSTFFGLDTLFGTSEIGFMEGIVGFFGYALVYTVLYVVMAFLAPRFRAMEGRTFSDIIGDTYGKMARVIAAACSFIYSTNSMEMMGMGFIFTLVFGVPFWVGVLVSAVIVVAYTYAGGLWADAVTDTIQFFLMTVTLGAALILCWYDLGGFPNIVAGLQAYVGDDPSHYFHPLGGYLTPGLIIAYGLTALAVLCEPAFMQRIFAARTPRAARNALLIGTPIWASYELACTLLGLLAAAAVGLGMIVEPHPNQALLMVVSHYIPAGFIGFFLASVLAASMSTADSYLLVSAGNLVYDIYRPIFRPNIDDRSLIRLTRYGILVSAVVSVALSFVFERIMGLWVFQASVLLNTVLVPLYAAVFIPALRRFKLAGTLATAVGFFGTIVFYLLVTGLGSFSEDWATMIWEVNILGRTFEIWQEYGIFLVIPFVLLAYLVGVIIGWRKPAAPPGYTGR